MPDDGCLMIEVGYDIEKRVLVFSKKGFGSLQKFGTKYNVSMLKGNH